ARVSDCVPDGRIRRAEVQGSCRGDEAAGGAPADLRLRLRQCFVRMGSGAEAALRTPDQPRTRIDVTYGESKGKLAIAGQAMRSMEFLETVAQPTSERLAWPTPFELELQTCGAPDAHWVPKTRKVTLCYEMVADFADLYRAYGAEPAADRKRTTAQARHQ